MNGYALARVLHVLGVVLWIGGVAMVTTVIIPAVRRFASVEEQVAFFERVESRFAMQARVTTLVTGLSGFYMLWVMDGWNRLLSPAHWWLHAMILVWLVFTLMLFVLEPLILHRWFEERAKRDPEGTMAIISRMHVFLLSISLLTVAGAVAGSHGWFWFGT
ncbi:DUF4149 domain-containing protein [Sulfidibacter corallicola]|uniref:Copper resistance protein D n=1 Tax=Sulfidibacter corallicola TaxID=2818388 RepID=A0A8A4TI63_SULCO|nr:hypothetical protein [Sulfidibacter corallicola]QTD49616.1 hypothetical protein J3U87_28855 [Sulfidibacter corallicola]